MASEGSLHMFTSLHLSMHTLFQTVAGGLEWVKAFEALVEISWVWAYIFSF